MKRRYATYALLLGALALPLTSYGADSDSDRSSPKAFVKDAAITAKIKAELAENKLSSVMHIRVDTDQNGVVTLSGTAKTQAQADQAVSIARKVDGVVRVENRIRVVGDS